MRILITGSTGYIGQQIINWMIVNNNKDDIIASAPSLEKAKLCDWYGLVDFIPCDFYKQNLDYMKYFKNPDLLIHIAWKYPYQNTVKQQFEANIPANIRFLSSFANSEESIKIVGIGSSSEYGNIGGCLSEDMNVIPTTPYSVAKNTLRQYLELVANEKELEWNWIREFNVYGGIENPHSIFGQLNTAINNGDKIFNMSSGEQQRDYVKVEDAAENICKIALQKRVNGIVNSCTGIPRSLKSLVDEYIQSHKSNIMINYGYYPYRDNEAMIRYGDVQKLNKCLYG